MRKPISKEMGQWSNQVVTKELSRGFEGATKGLRSALQAYLSGFIFSGLNQLYIKGISKKLPLKRC